MSRIVLEKIATNSPHLEWIKDNTVFFARHGSHAYGTNTESSDEDFKGICIPTKEYFIGSLKRFEQAELKDPDTVVYEIRKFFNLAIQCNPNIIELLHVSPSDYIYVDSIGREILDNKDKFISKKIKHTFLGYSVSQLKRIMLHKRWIMNPPKSPPSRKEMGLPEQTLIPQDQLTAAFSEVQKELDKQNFDFMDNLEEPIKIEIRNIIANMLAEMKITADDQWLAASRKIGLNDNFIEIMQKERAYNSKKKEFDQYQNWKKNRNPARAALEEKYGYDSKHAYHLVRLIRMCREVLTTGKVIVKRPDREELLAIRNGAWSYEKLLSFAEKEEKDLEAVYQNSTLPKSPDSQALDNLCMKLIERSLSNYSFYSLNKRIKNVKIF